MTQKRFLLLAAGLAASLPALACTTCDKQPPGDATAAAIGADALTVTRDAATGQLRLPTAAELAALTQRAAEAASRTRRTTVAAPTSVLTRQARGGAVNVRLTTEFASYAAVVVQPDGTLAERCVHAPDGATALQRVHGGAQPFAQPITQALNQPVARKAETE